MKQKHEILSLTESVPVWKPVRFVQSRHSTTGCSSCHFTPKWTQSQAATIISQTDTATCQNRHLHRGRHEYVRCESTRGLCDCSRGIGLSLQAGIREIAAFIAVQESVNNCRLRSASIISCANFASVCCRNRQYRRVNQSGQVLRQEDRVGSRTIRQGLRILSDSRL